MRILDLGKYRRARVWIGDLPDAIYKPEKILDYRIPTEKPAFTDTKTAAVEVVIPTGARVLYGLIGARIEPTTMRFVDVSVGISNANGRLFYNSLAANDVVRVGLPEEYAEAVLKGVDLANSQPNGLAAARMLIDCAAHGPVGSSSDMFKGLATFLTKILNASEDEVSDNGIIQFFLEVWPGR